MNDQDFLKKIQKSNQKYELLCATLLIVCMVILLLIIGYLLFFI